jgi:hypothetical protein
MGYIYLDSKCHFNLTNLSELTLPKFTFNNRLIILRQQIYRWLKIKKIIFVINYNLYFFVFTGGHHYPQTFYPRIRLLFT